MKITPRYDGDPIVQLDGPPSAIGTPLLRQRRRFAKTLERLTPEQWATPSRCEGWRVQDVVAHLTGTDQYWNLSVQSGLAGNPTRFLAEFDPKATPAQMVNAVRDTSPEETLSAFLAASEALCSTIESLDDNGWTTLGESPPGHVTMSALAHHALWDSWVHERDVLEPLGIKQDEEADEIVASLRYTAGLGPTLALQTAPELTGAIALDVTAPDARIAVRVGDQHVSITEGEAPEGALVLTGNAVELLEALSVRAPWSVPIDPDKAWLLAGLAEVFEETTAR